MTKAITLAVVGLLLFATATPATSPTCAQNPNLACAPLPGAIGIQPKLCSGTDKFSAVDSNGNITCSADTGGGGTSPNLIPLSACMPITGSSTIFFAPGTCADPAEAAILLPVKNSGIYGAIQCQLSGTTGAASVTITGRTGSCTGSISDSTLICTIGAGSSNCTSGNSMSVTGGQCMSFRATPSGALPSALNLNCSLERVG